MSLVETSKPRRHRKPAPPKRRLCPVQFEPDRLYLVVGHHRTLSARRMIANAQHDDPRLKFQFVASPRLPAPGRVAICVAPFQGLDFSEWVGTWLATAIINARCEHEIVVTYSNGAQSTHELERIPETFADALADLIAI